MIHKRIGIAVLVTVATSMLSGCGHKEDESRLVRSVAVEVAEESGGSSLRTVPGVVKEESEINVGFMTPGQIKEICVREGQHVSKGEVLARLDDKDYRLGVAAAEAQYSQLFSELERIKPLYEAGDVSPNDYNKAESGLRQLEAQLQVNRNKLGYTVLRAPASGIIRKVNFDPSEVVDAGTPVFLLLASTPVKVELNVPAWIFEHRERISSINIISGSDSLPGSLLSMVPKADALQLYRVVLGVGASSPSLVPGRNVMVEFRMSDGKSEGGMVSIPASSVVYDSGKASVWVVMPDSTVRRRELTVSSGPLADRLNVSSGLSAGEIVVRAGTRHLREGEKVAPLAPVSETNVGGLL